MTQASIPVATAREGMMLTPSIRLRTPLASGGMGTVWLAEHLGLNTTVVVKFMSAEVAAMPEVAARFTREAAAASQVKSPHVVQMLDHGVSSEGLAYIAMELLEGCSLATQLDRTPVVPPKQAATIVGSIAKALARAHEKGIVHRDIKPDNVFLCDVGDGEAFVKVLDFGIAKVATSMASTKTGSMLGTPLYMSPELILGAKAADLYVDLWALAIVAYEMLTGRRPVDGETFGAIAVQLHTGDFVPPSRVNATLSPAIDAWFARACAKDIARRFSSAREFAEAFEVAVGGAERIRIGGPSASVATPATATENAPAQVFTEPARAPLSDTEIAKTAAIVPRAIVTTISAASVVAPAASPSSTLSASKTRPQGRAALWVATGMLAVVGGLSAFLLTRSSGEHAEASSKGAPEPPPSARAPIAEVDLADILAAADRVLHDDTVKPGTGVKKLENGGFTFKFKGTLGYSRAVQKGDNGELSTGYATNFATPTTASTLHCIFDSSPPNPIEKRRVHVRATVVAVRGAVLSADCEVLGQLAEEPSYGVKAAPTAMSLSTIAEAAATETGETDARSWKFVDTEGVVESASLLLPSDWRWSITLRAPSGTKSLLADCYNFSESAFAGLKVGEHVRVTAFVIGVRVNGRKHLSLDNCNAQRVAPSAIATIPDAPRGPKVLPSAAAVAVPAPILVPVPIPLPEPISSTSAIPKKTHDPEMF